MASENVAPEQAARDQAVKRLKKKRDFRGHLIVYLLINTFLVVIWAIGSHGFFWPAFVIVGWGIGLAMNAWDVYGRQDLSEQAIQREMERRPGRTAAS
jgi:uncharacterized ion transporter superfamily protein YfcC